MLQKQRGKTKERSSSVELYSLYFKRFRISSLKMMTMVLMSCIHTFRERIYPTQITRKLNNNEYRIYEKKKRKSEKELLIEEDIYY